MSNPEELSVVIEVLEEIIDDKSVPRNIRKSAEEIKDILLNKPSTLAVKINSAISILDEVSNDPNLPEHTRTMVWDVASTLETLQS